MFTNHCIVLKFLYFTKKHFKFCHTLIININILKFVDLFNIRLEFDINKYSGKYF